eukprot:m.190781 g.190781  ORF g.190781 m.190781 type:complete len:150 (-) comp18124_c0_seq1:283-732(-)
MSQEDASVATIFIWLLLIATCVIGCSCCICIIRTCCCCGKKQEEPDRNRIRAIDNDFDEDHDVPMDDIALLRPPIYVREIDPPPSYAISPLHDMVCDAPADGEVQVADTHLDTHLDSFNVSFNATLPPVPPYSFHDPYAADSDTDSDGL